MPTVNRPSHSESSVDRARRGRLILAVLPLLAAPILFEAVSRLVFGWLLGLGPQPMAPIGPPLAPIVVFLAVAATLLVLVRLGWVDIAAYLLVGGWTVVAGLIGLAQGPVEIGAGLLVMPICAAGLLLNRWASLVVAAWATAWLGLSLWGGADLAAWGRLLRDLLQLPPGGPFRPGPPLPPPPPVAASWISLYWTVAAMVFMLAGALQTALSRSRAQAIELAAFNRDLEQRVADQTAQIIEQARATATAAERARLARDIHDTLAQSLTGIVVQLGAARRALAQAPVEAENHVELAQHLARQALAEARRSVWNLRAAPLERGSLGDALRGLADTSLPNTIVGSFTEHGDGSGVAPTVEQALLRVCQEALANVAKHSGADRVEIELWHTPSTVRLVVRDNGVGLPDSLLAASAAPPGAWTGFGLRGMRERLAAIGGSLKFVNDNGAVIEAEAPRAGAEGVSTAPAVEAAAVGGGDA